MRLRMTVFIRLFVAMNLLVSSTASASLLSAVPGLGKSTLKKAEELGVKSTALETNAAGETVVKFLAADGSVVSSAVIGKGSKEALEAASPSALRQYFSIVKNQGGTILKQKLMHFPAEAFRFFIAIGAITTAELVFNYNDNPTAMDQFLTSQKDPVGQIGFAAFMMANGIVAEPLMAIVKSNKLRPFIPYLGMTAGMMASNIVHEVGMIVPQMIECAKTGQKCEEAYKIFTSEGFNEKAHEWAPNLASMFVSTFGSGLLEVGLRKTGQGAATAAKAAAASAARLMGVELAMSLTPAGWVVRGGKWVYQISQLATFVYLDTLTQAPFRFGWKTAVQVGPALRLADFHMGLLLKRKLTTNGWKTDTDTNQWGNKVCETKDQKDCYLDLDEELTRFTKLMAKWREANLEAVLTKQASWNQYVHELSSQYRTGRQFYFDFVTDLWKKKKADPSYVHLMDRALPLFGVNVKEYSKDESNLLLLKPTEAQERQMLTVKDVVQEMQKQSDKIAALVKDLPKHEQQLFSNFHRKLSSEHPMEVGAAIQIMREQLGLDSLPGPVNFASEKLRSFFKQVYQALGNPKPMMEPGRGYLQLMAENPDAPLMSTSPFPRGVDRFLTPTAPEYLAAQMVVGPDVEAGDKSVHYNVMGFPGTFNPPMIRAKGEVRLRPKLGANQTSDRSIFNSVLQTDRNDAGNLFDFLRLGGVRADIVGNDEGSGIGAWWEKYPEEEMFQAWKFFEGEYEETVQQFYRALYNIDNSAYGWRGTLTNAFNRSPVSNGLLAAMQEEQFTYLYILDGYLQTSLGKKDSVAVPQKTDEYSTIKTAKAVVNSDNAWTKAVLVEWNKTKDLLAKLKEAPKTTKKGKRDVLVSRITNKEIEEQEKALITLIDQYPFASFAKTDEEKEVLNLPRMVTKDMISPFLPEYLRIGKSKTASFIHAQMDGNTFAPLKAIKPDAKADKNKKNAQKQKTPPPLLVGNVQFADLTKTVKLSDFEIRLLKAALNGLKAVAAELSNYGQVINNVSYAENFEGSALTDPKKKNCVKMPSDVTAKAQNAALRKYCEGQ